MANKHAWTPEQIQEKADAFRLELFEELEKQDLGLEKFVLRLNEALDANEIKTAYDKELCEWSYSKDLIAHMPRLKAIEIMAKVLGLYAPEKRHLSGPGGGAIPVKYEDIDPERRAKIDKILDDYYKKGKK